MDSNDQLLSWPLSHHKRGSRFLQSVGERPWGGGKEAAPAEAEGFSACFTLLYFLWRSPGQGQSQPAPWGSHWQEQATTVSLLPAASSMPKLAPALRGPFPLLAGLTQLTSSFGFSKITPLPGNLHLRSSCSYSLLGSISLDTHDPRGTHSCNLLMRIK